MRNNNFKTPPVVTNLLIINVLFFLATEFLPEGAVNFMYQKFALFFWKSDFFMPHQIVTYMFMHGSLMHLFSNMFAVWMFGRILEYNLGSRRFLIYYLICGIGAGLIQLGVNWIDFVNAGTAAETFRAANASTIGASGAVFGILLAFGMLYPNSQIVLLFPPIPLKAKYFVIIYGVFELFAGISGRMDGIAHFAHLGGMLWGFLLLYYWKKKGKIFY